MCIPYFGLTFFENMKRKIFLLQSRIETTVSVLHLLISAMEKVTARGAVSDGRKREGKDGENV
jgi:hypothetical protein